VKVTGFTFIRNALIYDYPIREAILSVMPLCDEFVVAVGNSDDETLELIQQLDSPKIRILETVWDDSLRANGEVLAVETNKAFNPSETVYRTASKFNSSSNRSHELEIYQRYFDGTQKPQRSFERCITLDWN
jgi:hypothetical protein